MTGYWFLKDSDDWQPSSSLQQFLDAGEPPVYVGFGSMPGLDPDAFTKNIVATLDYAGIRGVLSTGGGALGDQLAADHVHIIEGAPHDRLFPLMGTCTHHGGAGTTAAALRAGKPQIICPFFGDQPFWARQMVKLGVAGAPINRRHETTASLTYSLLQATEDSSLQEKASALALEVRAEDGVSNAMGFLEKQGLLAPLANRDAATSMANNSHVSP